MLFVAIFGLRVKNLIIWSVLSHFVQWHFFLFCQNSILDSGDFILEIDLFWLAKYSWNQFPNTRISYYFWLKSCPWKNLISNTISDFMPVHQANCRLSVIALQRVPYPKQKTLSHQRKLLIKLVVYASAMKKNLPVIYIYIKLSKIVAKV